MNRRRFGAVMAALVVPSVASAADKTSFEGTWGGAEGELSAQVIVAGGTVIGFFWRTDYTDATNVKLAGDGRSLAFDFPGGHAVLSRQGEATATLAVTEGSKVVTRLKLQRD